MRVLREMMENAGFADFCAPFVRNAGRTVFLCLEDGKFGRLEPGKSIHRSLTVLYEVPRTDTFPAPVVEPQYHLPDADAG